MSLFSDVKRLIDNLCFVVLIVFLVRPEWALLCIQTLNTGGLGGVAVARREVFHEHAHLGRGQLAVHVHLRSSSEKVGGVRASRAGRANALGEVSLPIGRSRGRSRDRRHLGGGTGRNDGLG